MKCFLTDIRFSSESPVSLFSLRRGTIAGLSHCHILKFLCFSGGWGRRNDSSEGRRVTVQTEGGHASPIWTNGQSQRGRGEEEDRGAEAAEDAVWAAGDWCCPPESKSSHIHDHICILTGRQPSETLFSGRSDSNTPDSCWHVFAEKGGWWGGWEQHHQRLCSLWRWGGSRQVWGAVVQKAPQESIGGGPGADAVHC